MARIQGNSETGKLGNKIYYTWYGRQCERSMPTHVANPRTEAQQAHRSNFTQISKLSSYMKEAHLVGLHGQAVREKNFSSTRPPSVPESSPTPSCAPPVTSPSTSPPNGSASPSTFTPSSRAIAYAPPTAYTRSLSYDADAASLYRNASWVGNRSERALQLQLLQFF